MATFSFRHVQRETWLLAACAAAHALFTLGFALSRLYGFKGSLLDSGVFNQLEWNLLHHGRLVTTATVPFAPQQWLGFHFSPILVALAPVYALWPHLELLQAVQSLCIGFGGVMLFHALRAAGAHTAEAWAGSALFWLNPFVLSAAIWDFHEIAFAVLLLPAALWALLDKRFGTMLAILVLLVLTKEQYGLSAAGCGLLWGWRYREWKCGLWVTAAGAASFATVFFIGMPAFGTHGIHPMFTDASTYNRYGWLDMPWHSALHTLGHIVLGRDAQGICDALYLYLLLSSGLFLPLIAPVYLAAGAGDWVANLLSADPFPRHLAAYHSAALVPVVIVAAYQGYAWLKSRFSKRMPWVYCALGVALLFSPYTLAFYPLSFWELHGMKGMDATGRNAIAFVQGQFPQGPVSAQCNVAMFFSGRSIITPFPYGAGTADAVVLRLDDPYLHHENNHFGLPFYGSTGRFAANARALLRDPRWHVAYWNAPWLVMGRGSSTGNEQGARQEILQRISHLETEK